MKEELSSLWKGESVALLKALHILTRDEKLNADSRRKLKQVHHLSQLIEPLIKKLHGAKGRLSVVDMGAGKSYLGFILMDLVLKHLPDTTLTSIENRGELMNQSQKLAQESGFDQMKFVASSIEDAQVEGSVDLVCALHACDTATDDAILFGLKHEARAFALVPCCQAEVARELEKLSKAALYAHPIHRREFGSHLTNVIRTLFLSTHGFKVTATELIGWEHSMKNELILAEKISDKNHPESKKARAQLEALLTQFPVKMKLLSHSAP